MFDFDLSDVDAKKDAGGPSNFDPLPAGSYKVKVEKVSTKMTLSGYGIVDFSFQVVDGPSKNRYANGSLFVKFPNEYDSKGKPTAEKVTRAKATMKQMALAAGYIDAQTADDAQKHAVTIGAAQFLPAKFNPEMLTGKVFNVKLALNKTDTNETTGKQYHKYYINGAEPLLDDDRMRGGAADAREAFQAKDEPSDVPF